MIIAQYDSYQATSSGSWIVLAVELFFIIVWWIIIPIIIGKKLKNVALKCTILLLFNPLFSIYYFIKAVTEKH